MLTEQQVAILVNYVTTDPAFAGIPQTGDGAYEVRDRLDVVASPAFVVWKTSVTLDEIMQNGFDWVLVDNLSVGKARIWEWLFDNAESSTNPSKINVRAGISECWKGTAAMLAQQAVILGHCKRSASRLEKLLATGTGSDATPATMTIEGSLSPQYLREILGW